MLADEGLAKEKAALTEAIASEAQKDLDEALPALHAANKVKNDGREKNGGEKNGGEKNGWEKNGGEKNERERNCRERDGGGEEWWRKERSVKEWKWKRQINKCNGDLTIISLQSLDEHY